MAKVQCNQDKGKGEIKISCNAMYWSWRSVEIILLITMMSSHNI